MKSVKICTMCYTCPDEYHICNDYIFIFTKASLKWGKLARELTQILIKKGISAKEVAIHLSEEIGISVAMVQKVRSSGHVPGASSKDDAPKVNLLRLAL